VDTRSGRPGGHDIKGPLECTFYKSAHASHPFLAGQRCGAHSKLTASGNRKPFRASFQPPHQSALAGVTPKPLGARCTPRATSADLPARGLSCKPDLLIHCHGRPSHVSVTAAISSPADGDSSTRSDAPLSLGMLGADSRFFNPLCCPPQ
jgi:hypothetical protein